MDVSEAIHLRKSIRAFKSEPVPQEVLKKIIELASRAPSWENTQPWEFAIVGGEKLEEIRQAFTANENTGEGFNPDLSPPGGYPEPYDARRRAVGMKVYEIKSINREDKEKRRLWRLQGLRLFEAPNVIYIYTDRSFYFQDDSLNIWPIFDCGLVAENIMLLATEHGLGTVAQIGAVLYPDVLRRILGIPDSKLLVLGIAIGYAEWNEPINQYRSERAPLDEVARWYGF